MFGSLSENELNIVADAMTIIKPGKGSTIIEQGKDGDDMFVVESGVFRCTRIPKGDFSPTFLWNFESGDAFGELALLYNAPRAATITSDKNGGVLYWLDRETFNAIVKEASQKKREKYEQFLSSVEILKTMEPYERSKLADVLKEKEFNKGDVVIREGEEGNEIYFIIEGEAYASKLIEPGKAS